MAKKDKSESNTAKGEQPKAAKGDQNDAAKETKAAAESITLGGFDVTTFFKETREELEKVVWPSRQQLISESLAVMLMVGLSAILIYSADSFFGWAAKSIFG